jgi:hypothetical protein
VKPSTDPPQKPTADLPQTVVQPQGEITPNPGLSDVTRTYGDSRPVEAGPVPHRLGKYQVVRPLGGGGQATAYLAYDPDLKRQVVLKLYHAARTPSEQDMVFKEGQALAQVRSGYVAQCYSAERHDGVPYLVMEYIPGKSLAEVQRDRPLDIDRSLELVSHLAEGLAAVHAGGLLHRDIKPSNVIVGDDGAPRLVDFGLAEPLASAALSRVSGTLPYMAPEQARGERDRVGPRSDLFALGAVLYELLTGTPPYQGATRQELLRAASDGVVVPPRQPNPKVPAAVNDVCMRCLARDPADRFASATELAEAVRRCRRGWRGLDLTFRLGRYRFQLAIGATVALLLLVAVPLALWNEQTARRGGQEITLARTPPAPALAEKSEPVGVAPAPRSVANPESPAPPAAAGAAPGPPDLPPTRAVSPGPHRTSPMLAPRMEKAEVPARHPVNGGELPRDFALRVKPVYGTLGPDGTLALKPGEAVALTVEPERPAYVGVWFARGDGSFVQLLPAAGEQAPRLPARRPRTVPEQGTTSKDLIPRTSPASPEYVQVRASTRPWQPPQPAARPEPGRPFVLFSTPEEEKTIREFLLKPFRPDEKAGGEAPAVSEAVVPVRVR